MSKQTIPESELKEFLENRITLNSMVHLKRVDCGFLWKRGDVERYRITVWTEDRTDESCPSNRIPYSAFVHYDRKNSTITDNTIEKVSEKKIF